MGKVFVGLGMVLGGGGAGQLADAGVVPKQTRNRHINSVEVEPWRLPLV